ATVFSVLGGIAGWYIGYYAFDTIAKPALEFYGKYDAFVRLRESADADFVLLLLVTSGLSHLPPLKVVTILSGWLHVNLGLFILSPIIAPGARFLSLAWLLNRYGEPIRHFIEERLGTLAALACAAIIGLYVAVRYLT